MSNNLTISPNRKGAITFCAICTPIFIGLGALFYFYLAVDVIEFFHLVTISGKHLGVLLGVLSFIPISVMVYTLQLTRCIILDDSGIKVSDKVSARWSEISHCVLQSYLGKPTLLRVVRKEGDDLMISWNLVDFGLVKLVDLIDENLSGDESEAE